MPMSRAYPGFQVRGAHLKKLRRAEGGSKIFGVSRVKNHDFTPKNHIFFNFRVWGGGGGAPAARPLDPPLNSYIYDTFNIISLYYINLLSLFCLFSH